MRLTASIAGVLVAVLIFTVTHSSASAFSLQDLVDPQPTPQLVALNTENENTEEQPAIEGEKPAEQKPEPQPTTHTVVQGESLSKIAKQYQTTWKRLFDKNTQVAHPDVINVNDVVVIPEVAEVLVERPLPEAAPVVVPKSTSKPTKSVTKRSALAKPQQRTISAARGSSAGNRYVAGYCTWYAKNRRSDLPNNLGNANTWVARARAQGIPTGGAPRVGAIGQQGMHVVFVEQVHGNGMVTISEMNFKGRGVISSRTVPASNFQYIY